MSDLFEKLPKKGQVWRHTKTGNDYLILGSAFNAITDRVDVVYQPLIPTEYSHFTRQAVGHPKGLVVSQRGRNAPLRFDFRGHEMSNLPFIISHIEVRLGEVEQTFAAEEIAAGYLGYERFREREAAYRQILHSLTETYGAKVREGDPAALALAGIRTSCTQGPRGLLTNWLVRARKAVDAGEAVAR